MAEIGLGQFLKNVFDYSTGKPVQQQPGKVANENFQKAHNEAVRAINQTMQNIAQNFVRQQDIMNTQMQLKELSNSERSMLLKNLFDFPPSMKDLAMFLAANGKAIAHKELAAMMTQEIDISKLILLMQANGKSALEKIQKMITTMNQSGIYDTRQLKEMTALINACIPASDASAPQVLKSLMVMYLPWLPLNESVGFNFGADENSEGKKSSGEDVITVIITTKNYGIVKILIYKEESGYNLDVNCSETFPKEELTKGVSEEGKALGINSEISYSVRKSTPEEAADETKVEFSKTAKVSPSLLYIIHAMIKLVTEIDQRAGLVQARKESL